MKLTKSKLQQIIKEEYGSMYLTNTEELIDAYDDLKEVLNYVKEVLGK